MKENLGDKIVDKMKERLALTRTRLASIYKTTKPFRMESISKEEALYEYEHMGMEDMMNRITRDGEDATNQYIYEMEQLKRRRR